MSATELDLPVLIASEQIRRREFVTTRRGYDPHQVRDYLEALADQVDVMASMIREARMEADAALRSDAEPRIDPYEQLGRRVGSLLREADEAAERFRVEGRHDAERLMSEARADADRVRADAQATADTAREQAEVALREAKEQADHTLGGLAARRDALVDQLAEMQERLLGVARDLEATIVAPEMTSAPDPIFEPPRPDAGTARPDIETPGAIRVVDIRTDAVPPAPPPMSIEALFADLDAEQSEDPWGIVDPGELEEPDIPALDLDWGDPEDDDPI